MQTKDDEQLDEVKAILRRLQRIGTGDEDGAAPADPEPASRSGASRDVWAPHKAEIPSNRANIAPAPQAASAAEKRPASARLWQVAFAAGPAILLIAGLAFAFWPKTGEAPRLASPGKAVKLGKTQPDPAAIASQRTTAAIPQADAPGTESSAGLQAHANSPAGQRTPADQDAERISDASRLIDEGKIVAGRNVLLDGLAEQTADAALALARSYDPNSVRLIANADAPPDIQQAERWYRRWHEIAVSDGLALDAERLDRIIKAMK
jgi:hypothetical protein